MDTALQQALYLCFWCPIVALWLPKQLLPVGGSVQSRKSSSGYDRAEELQHLKHFKTQFSTDSSCWKATERVAACEVNFLMPKTR